MARGVKSQAPKRPGAGVANVEDGAGADPGGRAKTFLQAPVVAFNPIVQLVPPLPSPM